jgi:creatinine amidohydrolase
VAAEELSSEGIILRYFNILEIDAHLPSNQFTQEGGSHADEFETSMMLYIAPETVDMSKAVKDYDARPNQRGLTRDPNGSGHYSPTGIWGDPTLATKEKGKLVIELTIREIVKQVKQLLKLQITP